MKPSLSVVIPSFNEMANLQKGVLGKVEHYLEKHKFDYEVIIVDDGSDDGSMEFAEQFTKENRKFKLLKNPHTGKAGAVTAGVLKGQNDLILFTDMDQATPIEEIEKLMPYVEDGYTIVIGSRRARKGAPFTRQVMAKGMVFLRSMLIGIKDISDTQCGFKMFRKNVAHTLFSKISELHHGFSKISGSSVTAGFDVEVLYLAQKMGYTIKEVPVDWLYVETRRVNPFKDSIDGLLDLLRIKARDLRGKYK